MTPSSSPIKSKATSAPKKASPSTSAHLADPVDAVALQRAAAMLWATPIVPDRQVARMLYLPYSTWCGLKRKPGTPRGFTLGRRLYFKTEDLRTWIDGKAAATAGTPWPTHRAVAAKPGVAA